MDEDSNLNTVPAKNYDAISWSASEFVDIQKNMMWFVCFSLAIIAISVFIFFISKSLFSSIIIFLIGLILEIISARKPRTIQYEIDQTGIKINNLLYPYSSFKNYSIVNSDGLTHIILDSLKRFAPAKDVYFEPNDSDQIIQTIGQYLPLKIASNDPLENFIRRIKL